MAARLRAARDAFVAFLRGWAAGLVAAFILPRLMEGMATVILLGFLDALVH